MKYLHAVKRIGNDTFVIYSSSADSLRMKKSYGHIESRVPYTILQEGDIYQFYKHFVNIGLNHVRLKLDRKRTFQKIYGFGATFTDAAGINIKILSEKTQDNLINSLFGKYGMEYNMGRVPIGGTDFSTHPYAYNEYPTKDAKLTNFSLTMEDYQYKIPMIKKAQKVATDELRLVASTWSPPLWMKTNKSWGGPSRLIFKYYQTYADYHIRFLEEYFKNNVTFWGITPTNEPYAGVCNLIFYNTLGWMAENMTYFIENHFGPAIRNSKFSNIKIIALDDTRQSVGDIDVFAQNKKAFSYIDGISTHMYFDFLFPTILMDLIHDSYPEKFIISLEASIGMLPWIKEKVQLGSWSRAEETIKSMIEYFNSWYTGWIDWNIALSDKGGPNWNYNFVDANILVVEEKDEFYKQPMFYALAHFSKFVPRNSKRIFMTPLTGHIDSVAFIRPDGGVVIILCNTNEYKMLVSIEDPKTGLIEVKIPRKSFHTILYW